MIRVTLIIIEYVICIPFSIMADGDLTLWKQDLKDRLKKRK